VCRQFDSAPGHFVSPQIISTYERGSPAAVTLSLVPCVAYVSLDGRVPGRLAIRTLRPTISPVFASTETGVTCVVEAFAVLAGRLLVDSPGRATTLADSLTVLVRAFLDTESPEEVQRSPRFNV
jgi:hypothetical protein